MLDSRGDRRNYWYTSEREGGRVRRVYRCAGAAALEVARGQEDRRSLREAERADERRAGRAHDEAMGTLDELGEWLGLATRAVLEGLGYRRHARGDWRLRRRGRHDDAERLSRGAEGGPGEGVGR